MIDTIVSECFACFGGQPCCEIYGKSRREADWRRIRVYASQRHDMTSRWPLVSGSCVTWSSQVILIGWDFARALLQEQIREPASRQFPVEVCGGRLKDQERRAQAQGPSYPSYSEIMAHECGHTWQALWLGPSYLALVGSVTMFQEGPKPWNRFENEASEQGLFGGLVAASLCPRLAAELLAQR